LFSANKKLRNKLNLLLQEKLIKTKIKNLQDQAIIIKHKAEINEISAEEAEGEANKVEHEILIQKKKLEDRMTSNGLNADEISNRFNNLSI
jgi:hypothetical protein